MRINEVVKLTGVSARTLQYYDEIGLLIPQKLDNGYRDYTEENLEKLQKILFYRFLKFKLNDIKELLEGDFDNLKILEQQRELILREKEKFEVILHNIEKTISNYKGEKTMTIEEKFNGFKKEDLNKYENQAVEKYGKDTIEESKNSLNNLGENAKDSSEKAEKSAGGWTIFKQVIANLATEAINSALNAIKSLGDAIVDVGKQAYSNYANYEQLVGGIETLFKDSAPAVKKYANEAYKTAGMDANNYMQTITGFSASLIQGLGGNTKKAAEYGNRAIVDMSDNANKMGTDMASIQNAYQGFAKQNYTMLDNLKLGYGGTKTEMQRLIKDASKMTDVQKQLNVSVDSSSMSFDNIINAISVMQAKMGVAGTTSKEASVTIEGSVNSMKSAWKNMVTGIADSNSDIGELAQNLGSTIVSALKNILPRIQEIIGGIVKAFNGFVTTILPQLIPTIVEFLNNIAQTISTMLPMLIETGKQILTSLLQGLNESAPQLLVVITQLIVGIVQIILENLPLIIEVGIKCIIALIQGITESIPKLIEMLPTIINQIIKVLVDNLPLLINAGIKLLLAIVQGIVNALPQLIEMIPTIVESIIDILMQNLPLLVEASIQIIIAIITGIIKALPKLIEMLPTIIVKIVKTIIENLPKIIESGGRIISALIKGIGSMGGAVKNAIGEIIGKIKDAITSLPGKAVEWGKDVIKGLANGIKNAIHFITDAVKNVAKKITSFLHFSRPDEGPLREYEEWMPDMIQGLAKGIKDTSPILIKQTKELASQMSTALNVNGNIKAKSEYLNNNISNATQNNQTKSNYDMMVSGFMEALGQMKVEMDDEQFGKFVKNNVAREVFSY